MPGEKPVPTGGLFGQARSSLGVSYIFQFKQYGKKSTFDKFTAESKGIFCIQFHLELDATEFNRKIAVRKNDTELEGISSKAGLKINCYFEHYKWQFSYICF